MKLLHRNGGTITAIKAIGHETWKGVADWFFIGDVTWDDGSAGVERHIYPHQLCHDDTPAGKAEVTRLFSLMNDYLAGAGQFHEPKHKQDGRVVHWTPRAKSGRVEVVQSAEPLGTMSQ